MPANAPPDRRLRPTERVQRPSEFQAVMKGGTCFRDPVLRIHFRQNGREVSRLGMVVSRKVGGAVVRNRLKRLFRVLFRHAKHRLQAPIDVVFIPSSRAGPKDRASYEAVFERFLEWHGSRLKGNPANRAFGTLAPGETCREGGSPGRGPAGGEAVK